ncbi:MAG: hypothetical protein LBS21_04110 [Clostridiales bacterium]|nr:hypothetical protein [Clostridiales bacterium]
MASWLAHLRIADKLLDGIGSLPREHFIVGNIAPDSGEPVNGNWNVFTPSKNVSHWEIEGIERSQRSEKFKKRLEVLQSLDRRTFVYGTNNPAKLESMRSCLAPLGLKIVGLKETGITVAEADENGKTPLENARIKALAYYRELKRPLFACDSGLYIDGLTENEQPGVNVRMVGGKRLTDDEMIKHYTSISAKLGGKPLARYKNAICLIISENEVYEHFGDDISGDAFRLTDKPHPNREEGFPLDSISVHPETGEYYYWRGRDTDTGMTFNGFQRFFSKVLNAGRVGEKL